MRQLALQGYSFIGVTFFFLDLDQRHSCSMGTVKDASMRQDYNILRLLPNLGTSKMSETGCTGTGERSLGRWHLLGHLDRDHRHRNKYDRAINLESSHIFFHIHDGKTRIF